MDALWSGTKEADIFGCTSAPSVGKEGGVLLACVSLPLLPSSITPLTSAPSTFAQGGDLQWEADDAHKVIQGHKGPKDGSDPQGLTLSGLDQLEMVDRMGKISDSSDPRGHCSVPTILTR